VFFVKFIAEMSDLDFEFVPYSKADDPARPRTKLSESALAPRACSTAKLN